jgi:hypothetical protein
MECWNTFSIPTLHSISLFVENVSILFYDNEIAGIWALVAVKK